MGNYATHGDVRSFKIEGEQLTFEEYEDAEIDEDILLAESFIESLTNDIFYPKTAVLKFDGSGNRTQFFVPGVPYRLVTLNSVNVYREDQTTLVETPVVNQDFTQYPFYLERAKLMGIHRARDAFGHGGHWPQGLQNVWIDGVWGRSAVPPEIKRATILLTAERLMPGCTLMAPRDVSQAVWSDLTITFKGGAETIGQATGYTEVDRLLAGYINYNGMFQAVPDTKQLYDGNKIRLVGR